MIWPFFLMMGWISSLLTLEAADERIAKIVKVCHGWRVKSDPFIHELKRRYRKKVFVGGIKTDEAKLLFDRTAATRLQFIELLENVSHLVEQGASEEQIVAVLDFYDKQIGSIAYGVLQDVQQGLIQDENQYLTKSTVEYLRAIS